MFAIHVNGRRYFVAARHIGKHIKDGDTRGYKLDFAHNLEKVSRQGKLA